MKDIIIDTDNIVEKAAEAMRNLSTALVEMGKAVTDCVNAIANAIGNITNDVFRAYVVKTCPNKYWVHMAYHAKKFRVRKKYMNKIIKYYADDPKREINSKYGMEAKKKQNERT